MVKNGIELGPDFKYDSTNPYIPEPGEVVEQWYGGEWLKATVKPNGVNLLLGEFTTNLMLSILSDEGKRWRRITPHVQVTNPNYNPYTPDQNEINGLRNKIKNLQEEVKNLNNCLENDSNIINALNGAVCQAKIDKKGLLQEVNELKNRVSVWRDSANNQRDIGIAIEQTNKDLLKKVQYWKDLYTQERGDRFAAVDTIKACNATISKLESTVADLQKGINVANVNQNFYKDCFTVSGKANKRLIEEKQELEAALEDVSVERERLEGEVKALKEKTVDYRKTWISGPVKIKLNCSGNSIGRGWKLEVNAEAMTGTQVWNSSGPRVLEFFCSSIQTIHE